MVGLTVLIGCMGQLHRLIRAAEVSAQPAPIASETRPLPMCRVQASRGFPPHARRSFFERVHGLSILLVGLRPGAHMREAQLLEGAIDRIVRHRESELLIQPMMRSHARQRTTPWIAGIGPSSTIRARKALCLELSLGGTPGEGILMRPSGPCSLNRITQSRSV